MLLLLLLPLPPQAHISAMTSDSVIRRAVFISFPLARVVNVQLRIVACGTCPCSHVAVWFFGKLQMTLSNTFPQTIDPEDVIFLSLLCRGHEIGIRRGKSDKNCRTKIVRTAKSKIGKIASGDGPEGCAENPAVANEEIHE